jgi:imidazolonepropionase-like amidohydrolase
LQQWIAQKRKFLEIPSDDRRRFLEVRRRILKALYDAGVPFALGSDAPQMWNVPGFSIHRELESLVAAGLTPFQALETGTRNIARHFGPGHDSGTIEEGRRADLVLLDANPLDSVRNTSRIAGVMVAGRWWSRRQIDERLASGQ